MPKRDRHDRIALWFVDGWGDAKSYPVRVKRALKCLLRSYGLKATAWTDAPEESTGNHEQGSMQR